MIGKIKRFRFLIVLTLVAGIFAVVGCSPSRPAGERIDWSRCGPLECGSIQVPADYRNPEAGSINIALLVHRAKSPGKTDRLSVGESRRAGIQRCIVARIPR